MSTARGAQFSAKVLGSGGKKRNSTSVGGGTMRKKVAEKICRVCGDMALSYNFNVLTCESCKAFFRRNAHKLNDLKCPFNNRCEIDNVSRRFCQRCRLTKCYAVGMKKELIMSEEALLEKKQRVQENKERRMQTPMDDVSESSYEEAPTNQMSVKEILESKPLDSSSMPHNLMRPNNEGEEMMKYNEGGSSDMGYYTQDHDYINVFLEHMSRPADRNATITSDALAAPAPTPAKPSPLTARFSKTVPRDSTHLGICSPSMVDQAQHLPTAVVAQQIVAHIGNSNFGQSVPTITDPALPVAMLPPVTPIIPIIPKATPVSSQLLSLLENTNTEMVTVHKDVFKKLLQRRKSCICTCQCGHYPPGSCVVDEVTKELKNDGGSRCRESRKSV